MVQIQNLVICMMCNKQDTYLVLNANILKYLVPEVQAQAGKMQVMSLSSIKLNLKFKTSISEA